ncbi:TetR/AcrR family transcriptional regulator [Undibacterium sp. Dicai25W]|uniref:TetR/AcrR family transcriptional regulator n=1 Tax=Undibacterium sp. Dicai25W TaxID=3413034 RepID=UPI003BEF96F8
MLTQGAILEAFVRLLVEKGYSSLTMRDIALVAGVGVGTLYEYFPGKRSIAAHCMQQRFLNVGVCMEAWIAEMQGRPLLEGMQYVLDRLIELHAKQVEEWSALILLERQISDRRAFNALYLKIADIWGMLFRASCDLDQYPGKLPELVHAAVYGVLYQTLMLSPQKLKNPEFSMQLNALVMGYLQIPSC